MHLDNQAQQGAVLACTNCTNVTFRSGVFNSNRGINGGVFYLQNVTSFIDQDSVYQSNKAISGAVFNCKTCGITLRQALLESNNCGSGCILYSSDNLINFAVKDSSIINNYASVEAAFTFVTASNVKLAS